MKDLHVHFECLPCCACSRNISNISQQWECCPFTIAVNHFHLVSWTQYNGYLGKLLKMMTKWWQNDYKMMTKWWQEVLMSVGWWDKLWLSLTFSFSNSTAARLSSNLGRASPKSNRWRRQVLMFRHSHSHGYCCLTTLVRQKYHNFIRGDPYKLGWRLGRGLKTKSWNIKT